VCALGVALGVRSSMTRGGSAVQAMAHPPKALEGGGILFDISPLSPSLFKRVSSCSNE
jgi:hypothetical protein